MHTSINGEPVRLILVFFYEQQATDYLTHLQDNSYQIGRLQLASLVKLAQEQPLRFTFNPEIVQQGELSFIKEGEHWMVKIDKLAEFVDRAVMARLLNN
ncbi:MAG: hypothetical protein AB1489_11720, partial [Acidobacteriota bacterium]